MTENYNFEISVCVYTVFITSWSIFKCYKISTKSGALKKEVKDNTVKPVSDPTDTGRKVLLYTIRQGVILHNVKLKRYGQ